jgi:tRNA/tmRNA/rRNA uracil-C5-methylase (TrmA/RlmC/RlmD family)
LSLAAAGIVEVTLVENDPVSGADLLANAEPFGDRVRVERRSVETYVARGPRPVRRSLGEGGSGPDAIHTFIVDPPRTGISREAMAGVIHARPGRLIYVSCDIATLARDTRTLVDAGYSLDSLTGMDLFPNTAHVESIATFSA